MTSIPDVAVIGAGVFGAWTAWQLRRRGQRVVLLDAYGPAGSRASSGGESRVIRMGYGPEEIYTRWAMRSLPAWRELSERAGPPLFHPTGVLFLARPADTYTLDTLRTLETCGARHQRLSRADLEQRYPQINLGDVAWAILEPDSGALMARRAVQFLVRELQEGGVEYRGEAVAAPAGRGRLEAVATSGGAPVRAGCFVFACGPWLPKLFPDLLADRIQPTRQEVFFFGTPAGDARFAPPAMPAWIDFGEEMYGIPDLENRGFKVAPDCHGPAFDPDTGDRLPQPEAAAAMRRFLARRFPALKDAPLVETRVCQYENTWNGDFLIDRHPDLDTVWLIGGGSGHGFKHGPALGEYVAARILDGGPVEPRFSLAAKQTVRQRAVH